MMTPNMPPAIVVAIVIILLIINIVLLTQFPYHNYGQ